MRIGVVGPCAAGKTTLINGLKQRGFIARHIAQEHSYVPDMWKRITNPDLLIFLDVSYPNTLIRRQLNWTESEYQLQMVRLNQARQYANLIIDTNIYNGEEVLDLVLAFLQKI